MKQVINSKRVLILGGTGLVGRNVVESLISRGIRRVAVCGLFGEPGWLLIKKLERVHGIRIKKYSANLLVPRGMNKLPLSIILSRSVTRSLLLRSLAINLTDKEIDQQPLYRVIRDSRPNIIVDCINTATQCAYFDKSAKDLENVGLGLLLLLRYYQVLHHLLRRDFWRERKVNFNVDQYLKVGTTGIGGMGFDIPFTHGEERPSISLMKKVGMAGAQTNILLAMGNSKGVANIQEIIPATSIFQLSGNEAINNSEINGGESRGYALEEFRLLTNRSQMGVIDAAELADIVVDATKIRKSRYDILTALRKSSVICTENSINMRNKIISSWQQHQKRHGDVSVGHGNLGPTRTRKLLFELYILLKYIRDNQSEFWGHSPRKIQKRILLEVSKDALLNNDIRYANLRFTTSAIPRNRVNADRYIDISTVNIAKWQKALLSLKLKRNYQIQYSGDILAQLIEQRRDLSLIP